MAVACKFSMIRQVIATTSYEYLVEGLTLLDTWVYSCLFYHSQARLMRLGTKCLSHCCFLFQDFFHGNPRAAKYFVRGGEWHDPCIIRHSHRIVPGWPVLKSLVVILQFSNNKHCHSTRLATGSFNCKTPVSTKNYFVVPSTILSNQLGKVYSLFIIPSS